MRMCLAFYQTQRHHHDQKKLKKPPFKVKNHSHLQSTQSQKLPEEM